jgi:hypothetical protein
MATLTQGLRPGEFIITEQDGSVSRDTGVVAINQTVLVGSILGQITKGTPTLSAITGTGNGTVTLPLLFAGAQVGVYTFRCITAATNNGTFAVFDPLGNRLPDAVLAGGVIAYTNAQIGVTITDGATDFVVGDSFTLTVPAGSGQYVLVAPAAVDGSAVAVGIAYSAITTASATGKIPVINFGAEVLQSSLNFGSLSAPQITTAIAQLATKFIKMRAGLN